MADTGAIDRDRLVADLTALVRIPSVTGSEEAVAAWAAGALGELGLTVETVRPDPGDDPGRPGLAGRGDAAHGRCRSSSGGPVARADAGSSCPATSMSCRPAIRRPGRPTRGAREVRDDALYGRGACDMKGGVAAILAAVRALGASWRSRPARRRTHRRVRPVRGGRRPGHARRDPRRRHGRPRDHHRAVEPRRRRRPRRRDHVPPDRAGSRGPRVAATRGRLRARQPVHPEPGARRRRDPAQRGRDRPADDRPRAAVPDDHRHRRGRGVGVDRARPDHRGRALRRPARPVGGGRRGGAAGCVAAACAADPFLRDHPADGRDHRRPVRVGPGPVRPPAAGRSRARRSRP